MFAVSCQALRLAYDCAQDINRRFLLVASQYAEPASPTCEERLRHLKRPSALLRLQKSVTEIDTSAVSYWRPMAFEPMSGPKDVAAFAVFEEVNADLSDAVQAWFKNIGLAYQSNRLGRHTPAAFQDGVCSLPADSFLPTGPKEQLRKLSEHRRPSRR